MKPRLLLHICCGPCATEVLRRLEPEFDVAGCFDNPNIFPEDEYQRRLAAVEELGARWHVPIRATEYDHDRFLRVVAGLEQEPEGGRRCAACFRLRLEAAADYARAGGFTHVASTLTVGPSKRAETINPIGEQVCGSRGLEFLARDWKKQDGFRRSVGFAKELGLYRQDYCGCEFSFRDRDERKKGRRR